jgi:hypothetical protein
MEADEPRGDAGVPGERRGDGLADERLGVGAGGVVEPHPELRAGHRRQEAHSESQQGPRSGRRPGLPSRCRHGRPCGCRELAGQISVCEPVSEVRSGHWLLGHDSMPLVQGEFIQEGDDG